MDVLQFNFPTVIRFGVGAVRELPAYLQSLNVRRPLVVTDPNLPSLDFFGRIMDLLAAATLEASVYCDLHKNPVAADVLAGTEAYDDHRADAIIGVGGGVAMDVARAIALRVNHRRPLFDYDELIGGDMLITAEIPPFVTVPTTAGTGSEVGRSAIIAEDDTHRKRILFHPSLMARRVFADPSLTHSLPPAITAATGMDALTHNLEAFLAKNYHPMADGIALEGLKLIRQNLVAAVKHPTPQARAGMMLGSLMGAVAFQKGLGVVHSLAHPLSTLNNLHHGLANAMMLPHGMRFNLEAVPDRFAPIADALDLEDGEAVVAYCGELKVQLGLPARLRDCGVHEYQLEALAELAVEDFTHPNNPRPVRREDFLRMYRAAY